MNITVCLTYTTYVFVMWSSGAGGSKCEAEETSLIEALACKTKLAGHSRTEQQHEEIKLNKQTEQRLD